MTIHDLNAEREARTPHWSGEARCLQCGHEWIAVAPAGTAAGLECPNCETMKGVSKQFMFWEDGTATYHCNTCDGELFSLKPNGQALCAGCGETHWPFA